MIRTSRRPALHGPRHGRLSALAMGLSATLLALPAAAASIDFPPTPLVAGSAVPPNIMFILDDSGSMTWASMPGAFNEFELPKTTPVEIQNQAYPVNTIYYNPATTYRPWKDAAGNYLPESTATAAYSSDDYATGASKGSTNLTSSDQTFYVPKAGITDIKDADQYYRYQIRKNGNVVRSERLNGAVASQPAVEVLSVTGLSQARNTYSAEYLIVVPTGASNLTVKTVGANGNANLYVGFGFTPSTGTYTYRENTTGSNETESISDPSTGTYHVRVHAPDSGSGAFNNLTLTASYTLGDSSADGCDTSATGWGWRNCTHVTPTGRTEAAELQNFTNWYSFHRTRIKVAKAGASYAFSDLGEQLRVGFRTIHSRNSFDIPVSTDQGLFRDTNRTTWFDRLFGAAGNSGTPLRSALMGVGDYYKVSTASGPWGPESGSAQLACRQNFAILTTDGFWNTDASSVGVGDSDNTAGTTMSGPNNVDYAYAPANPYMGAGSDTLADVAMAYWKTDLRDLDNIVPTSPVNPAFWQHMVTFGISIGLQGTLNPKTDLPALTSGSKSWPDPKPTENETRIDDLWHAAVNGRGAFVAASNPDEFASGLSNALAAIVQRTSSGSNVSVTGVSIQSDSRVFSASYVSGQWTGELAAYAVTDTGIATTASWRASDGIPTVRNLLTWDGAGAAFPTGSQTAALTAAIADYLVGVRSGEEKNGGTLRNRSTVLGDIIDSSPAYVKESAGGGLPATETVYIGANDGMLHAFDGKTGAELFGYVPAGIDLAKLKNYASPDYAHNYFVDGPVVVSRRAQTPGKKNILVGALGRGGKGVFALDVTDPANMGAGDVLWDKTGAAASAKMGNVLGSPFIAKLNSGDTGLIVSNGINSTGDKAVLYVYNLSTGAVLAEIDTKAGSAAAPNGLSAPKGWDEDGDGDLDAVYAGDLLGNLWKFDLSGNGTGSWGVANGGKPMFVATDPGGKTQPISAGVTIGLDPTTFKTWVFFGTGRFLTGNDVTDTQVQSWYGVMDEGAAIGSRSTALKERKIIERGTIAGKTVRSFEVGTVTEMAGKKGWYIDLVTASGGEGERMVSDPQMIGGALLAASVIPSDDPCRVGGSGFINALNAFTGGSLGTSFFDVDGDGDFAEEKLGTKPGPDGGKGIPVGSIDLGIGMPTMPAVIGDKLVACGSSGNCDDIDIDSQVLTGRISWHEILRN